MLADGLRRGARANKFRDPRIVLWCLATVVAVAIPLHAKGPAAHATVGPNLNVSADPAKVHGNTAIAVDRGNPLRLVAAASQVNDRPQKLLWSADGGNSWGTALMPLGTADWHWNPGVAWDSKGTAYASASAWKSGHQIQVVRSLDGGVTWSASPILVHVPSGLGSAAGPRMAVNHQPGTPCQDLVCLVWSESFPGKYEIHLSCAPEAQGPWTESVVATGDLLFAPTAAFGPTGELLVAWSNWGSSTLDQVRSSDCGLSFGPAGPIASAVGVFDHRFAIAGFSLPIPAACGNQPLVYPVLDVDRSAGPRRGSLYAVWADAEPGVACSSSLGCTGECRSNVNFSSSRDGGRTWSSATPVHEDLPGTDQFHPWLAVNDSDGAVHVVWYDTRNDAAREQTHVFYRRSADGGVTWEPEVQVTTASTDETKGASSNQYGYYTGLAVHGCGVWPLWTDRRALGGEQIYTAPMATKSAAAPPADLGNTLRLVADAGRQPALSWPDLGGLEVSYRVYRGASADFASVTPSFIGASGGPDTTSFSDRASPSLGGVSFYKVRATGACGEENASW